MSSTENRLSGSPIVFAAAAGLAMMASLFVTGDNWMRSEFDMVLATAARAPGSMDSSTSQTIQPMAASEDYWLGDIRRTHVTPAAWNDQQRLAVGDHLTLTIKGVEQVLEVVSVKTGPADLFDAKSGSAEPANQPLLVTLHPVGKAGSPVHLILEGKDDLSRVLRASDRPHEL